MGDLKRLPIYRLKSLISKRNNRTGTRPQFWLYCVIGRLLLVKMEKMFFGKLKEFETILRSKSWNDIIFLDYSSKDELIMQLIRLIKFVSENSSHWIEIELCSNGHLYCRNEEKQSLIIHEDWLSERRG